MKACWIILAARLDFWRTKLAASTKVLSNGDADIILFAPGGVINKRSISEFRVGHLASKPEVETSHNVGFRDGVLV